MTISRATVVMRLLHAIASAITDWSGGDFSTEHL
jgi:hypothetical protein